MTRSPFHLVYQLVVKGKRPFVVKIDPQDTVSSLAHKISKQQVVPGVPTSSLTTNLSSHFYQLYRVRGKLEELSSANDEFVYQQQGQIPMSQLEHQVCPLCDRMDPNRRVGEYFNGVLPPDRIHLLVLNAASESADKDESGHDVNE